VSISPVILAGGAGSRLWLLSRVGHPKQFLALNDEDTMLQATMKRLKGLNFEACEEAMNGVEFDLDFLGINKEQFTACFSESVPCCGLLLHCEQSKTVLR
jgi:mannose-1-phosphate guanylyltransferase